MRTYAIGPLLSLCLAAVATAAEPPLWKVHTNQIKTDWIAVLFNSATGQSWTAGGGVWRPLQEAGRGPARGAPGDYEVVTMVVPDTDNWYALRWNVKTGHSWTLKSGKWEPYTFEKKATGEVSAGEL